MLERFVVQRLVRFLGDFIEGGLQEEQLSLLFGTGNSVELRDVRIRSDRLKSLLAGIGSPVYVLCASVGTLRVSIDLRGRVAVLVRDLVVVLADQYPEAETRWSTARERYRKAILRIDQAQRHLRLQQAFEARPQRSAATASDDDSTTVSSSSLAGQRSSASPRRRNDRRDSQTQQQQQQQQQQQPGSGWAFFGSGVIESLIAYVADRLSIQVERVVLGFADQGVVMRRAKEVSPRGYHWITVAFLDRMLTSDWSPEKQEAPSLEPANVPGTAANRSKNLFGSAQTTIVRKRLALSGLRLSWIPDGSKSLRNISWSDPELVRESLWRTREENDADILGPIEFGIGLYVSGFRDSFRTCIQATGNNLDCSLSQLQYLDMVSAALRLGVGQIAKLSLLSEVMTRGSQESADLGPGMRKTARGEGSAPGRAAARERWVQVVRHVRQSVRRRHVPWTREHLSMQWTRRKQYLATYLAANVRSDNHSWRLVQALEETMDLEQILALRATAEALVQRSPQEALALCDEVSIAALVVVSTPLFQRLRQQRLVSWCLWMLSCIWRLGALLWSVLERRIWGLRPLAHKLVQIGRTLRPPILQVLAGQWLLSAPTLLPATSEEDADLSQTTEHILGSLHSYIHTDYERFLQQRDLRSKRASSPAAALAPTRTSSMLSGEHGGRRTAWESALAAESAVFQLDVSVNRVQLALFQEHQLVAFTGARAFAARSKLLSTAAVQHIGCQLFISSAQNLAVRAWLAQLQLRDEANRILVCNHYCPGNHESAHGTQQPQARNAEESVPESDLSLTGRDEAPEAFQLRLWNPRQGLVDLELDFAPLSVRISAVLVQALLRFWIPETLASFAMQGRRYAARVLHGLQERLVRSDDATLVQKLSSMFMRLRFGGMFIVFDEDFRPLESAAVTSAEQSSTSPEASPASLVLCVQLAGAEFLMGEETALTAHRQPADQAVLLGIDAFASSVQKAQQVFAFLSSSSSETRVDLQGTGTDEPAQQTPPETPYVVDSRMVLRFPGLTIGWCRETSVEAASAVVPVRTLLQLGTLRIGNTIEHCLVTQDQRPKLLARILVGILLERLAVTAGLSDIWALVQVALRYQRVIQDIQVILRENDADLSTTSHQNSLDSLREASISSNASSSSPVRSREATNSIPRELGAAKMHPPQLQQKRMRTREREPHLRTALSLRLNEPLHVELALDHGKSATMTRHWLLRSRIGVQGRLLLYSNQSMLSQLQASGISVEADGSGERPRSCQVLLVAPFQGELEAIFEAAASTSTCTTSDATALPTLDCALRLDAIDVVLPFSFIRELVDTGLAFGALLHQEMTRAAPPGSLETPVTITRTRAADDQEPFLWSADLSALPGNASLVFEFATSDRAGYLGVDHQGRVHGPVPLEQAARFRVQRVRRKGAPVGVMLKLETDQSSGMTSTSTVQVLADLSDVSFDGRTTKPTPAGPHLGIRRIAPELRDEVCQRSLERLSTNGTESSVLEATAGSEAGESSGTLPAAAAAAAAAGTLGSSGSAGNRPERSRSLRRWLGNSDSSTRSSTEVGSAAADKADRRQQRSIATSATKRKRWRTRVAAGAGASTASADDADADADDDFGNERNDQVLRACTWESVPVHGVAEAVLLRHEKSGHWIGRTPAAGPVEAHDASSPDEALHLDLLPGASAALPLRPLLLQRAQHLAQFQPLIRIRAQVAAAGVLVRLYEWMDEAARYRLPLLALSAVPIDVQSEVCVYPSGAGVEPELSLALSLCPTVSSYRLAQRRWRDLLEPVPLSMQASLRGKPRFVAFQLQLGTAEQPLRLHAYPRGVHLISQLLMDLMDRTAASRLTTDWWYFHNETEATLQLQWDLKNSTQNVDNDDNVDVDEPIVVYPGQSVCLYPPRALLRRALVRLADLEAAARQRSDVPEPFTARIQVVGFGTLPPVPLQTSDVVSLPLEPDLVCTTSATPSARTPVPADTTEKQTRGGRVTAACSAPAERSVSIAQRSGTEYPAERAGADPTTLTATRAALSQRVSAEQRLPTDAPFEVRASIDTMQRGNAAAQPRRRPPGAAAAAAADSTRRRVDDSERAAPVVLYWVRLSDGYRDHFYLYSRTKVANRCRSIALYVHGFLPEHERRHAETVLRRQGRSPALVLLQLGRTATALRSASKEPWRKLGRGLRSIFGIRSKTRAIPERPAPLPGLPAESSGSWYALMPVNMPQSESSASAAPVSEPAAGVLEPEQALFLGTFLRPTRLRLLPVTSTSQRVFNEEASAIGGLEFPLVAGQLSLTRSYFLVAAAVDASCQRFRVMEVGARTSSSSSSNSSSSSQRLANEYNIRPALTILHELPYPASLQVVDADGNLHSTYALDAWGSVEVCELWGPPRENLLVHRLLGSTGSTRAPSTEPSRTDGNFAPAPAPAPAPAGDDDEDDHDDTDVTARTVAIVRLQNASSAGKRPSARTGATGKASLAANLALHCEVERHTLSFRFGYFRARLVRSETRGRILVLYAPFLLCNQVPGISLCFRHVQGNRKPLPSAQRQLRRIGSQATSAVQRLAGQAVTAPKRLGAHLRPREEATMPERGTSRHPAPVLSSPSTSTTTTLSSAAASAPVDTARHLGTDVQADNDDNDGTVLTSASAASPEVVAADDPDPEAVTTEIAPAASETAVVFDAASEPESASTVSADTLTQATRSDTTAVAATLNKPQRLVHRKKAEASRQFLVPPVNLAEESGAPSSDAYLYCWKSQQALIWVNGAPRRNTQHPVRLAPFGRGNKGFGVPDALVGHLLELVTQVTLHSYRDRTAVLDTPLPNARILQLRPRFEVRNTLTETLSLCDAVDWERFRLEQAQHEEHKATLPVFAVSGLVPGMQQVPAAVSSPKQPGRAAVTFHEANKGRFARIRLDDTGWSGLIDFTDLNGTSVALPRARRTADQYWVDEHVPVYGSVRMDNGRLIWTFQSKHVAAKGIRFVNRTRFDLVVKQKGKRADRLRSLMRSATRDASHMMVQTLRGVTSGAASAAASAFGMGMRNRNTGTGTATATGTGTLSTSGSRTLAAGEQQQQQQQVTAETSIMPQTPQGQRTDPGKPLRITPDTSLDNAAWMIFHVPPKSERVFYWPEPLGSSKLLLKLLPGEAGLATALANPQLFADAVVVPTRQLHPEPRWLAQRRGHQPAFLYRMIAQGPERHLVVDEGTTSTLANEPAWIPRFRLDAQLSLPTLYLNLYNLQARPLLEVQLQQLEVLANAGLRPDQQLAIMTRLDDLVLLNRMDRARSQRVVSKTAGSLTSGDDRSTPAPATNNKGVANETPSELLVVALVLRHVQRDLLHVSALQVELTPLRVNLEPALLYETVLTLVSCYDRARCSSLTATQRRSAMSSSSSSTNAGAGIGSSVTSPGSCSVHEAQTGRREVRSTRAVSSGALASLALPAERTRSLPAVYMEQGAIGDLQILLTWRKSSAKLLLARVEAAASPRLAEAVQQIRDLLAYVPAVRDAPMRLSGIMLTEYLATMEQLVHRIVQHYIWSGIRNGYALVGSLDMLGAPLNIWGHTSGRVQAISQDISHGRLGKAGKHMVTFIGGTVGDVGQSFTGALSSFGGMAWRRLKWLQRAPSHAMNPSSSSSLLPTDWGEGDDNDNDDGAGRDAVENARPGGSLPLRAGQGGSRGAKGRQRAPWAARFVARWLPGGAGRRPARATTGAPAPAPAAEPSVQPTVPPSPLDWRRALLGYASASDARSGST